MQFDEDTALSKTLAWCTATLGRLELLSDHSRHPDSALKATVRINTSFGICYIKIHENEADWAQELHGYEQWAQAFGKLVAQTDYALDTIVWASRVNFYGSLREGQEAATHLAKQLL